MLLTITGPAVPRKQYVRVPMHDGLGAVAAYIKWNRVVYRPKGGTLPEREARAALLALAMGGEVAHRIPDEPTCIVRFDGGE